MFHCFWVVLLCFIIKSCTITFTPKGGSFYFCFTKIVLLAKTDFFRLLKMKIQTLWNNPFCRSLVIVICKSVKYLNKFFWFFLICQNIVKSVYSFSWKINLVKCCVDLYVEQFKFSHDNRTFSGWGKTKRMRRFAKRTMQIMVSQGKINSENSVTGSFL